MTIAIQKQLIAFLFLFALSLLIWWHPLVNTFALARNHEAYTHIFLIVPLSLALARLKVGAMKDVSKRSALAGWPVLAIALALAGVARWTGPSLSSDKRLFLAVVALVVWWIGSVRLVFGGEVCRSLRFPLYLLFLLAPLPGFIVDEIVSFLQHQSAFAARGLFWVFRVPATQDDVFLSIPGLEIEVAQECSSIRSSLMLMVTTMVLAHLFLRSWWARTLLILAAIPLAIAKNGLRVFVIAELGMRVDPGFFTGRLHHSGGILFFGLAVILTVGFLLVLRRLEGNAPEEQLTRCPA